jgi:hypothetical protein
LVWNPQRKSFEILDSLDFRVPKAHTWETIRAIVQNVVQDVRRDI